MCKLINLEQPRHSDVIHHTNFISLMNVFYLLRELKIIQHELIDRAWNEAYESWGWK